MNQAAKFPRIGDRAPDAVDRVSKGAHVFDGPAIDEPWKVASFIFSITALPFLHSNKVYVHPVEAFAAEIGPRLHSLLDLRQPRRIEPGESAIVPRHDR